MDGKRLIEKIRLRNILSFGDKGEEIELQPLNIIIGQNASGKSNFINAIELLRTLPQEKGLIKFISQNGGLEDLIWKGRAKDDYSKQLNKIYPRFKLEVTIKPFNEVYVYEIEIGDLVGKTTIQSEYIKFKDKPEITRSESLDEDESLISLKGITAQNEHFIKLIIWTLSNIQFYKDISTNTRSEVRKAQRTDGISEFLTEDIDNLFIVLSNLQSESNVKSKIIEYLKKFNPRINDISFQILGGFIGLRVHEEGIEKSISAMRLSDGTLRYLCLLAILCHPEPPPLVCIEEPETGLHPDILPTIAELMIEASQRTQLIVTTHSDILVSAFSEIPEAVLVCEKDEDGTHFKRLEKDKLKVWLEEYSLGEAWLRGAIGGTRW